MASNWELLYLYCHDNEHQKQIEADRGYTDSRNNVSTTALALCQSEILVED